MKTLCKDEIMCKTNSCKLRTIHTKGGKRKACPILNEDTDSRHSQTLTIHRQKLAEKNKNFINRPSILNRQWHGGVMLLSKTFPPVWVSWLNPSLKLMKWKVWFTVREWRRSRLTTLLFLPGCDDDAQVDQPRMFTHEQHRVLLVSSLDRRHWSWAELCKAVVTKSVPENLTLMQFNLSTSYQKKRFKGRTLSMVWYSKLKQNIIYLLLPEILSTIDENIINTFKWGCFNTLQFLGTTLNRDVYVR